MSGAVRHAADDRRRLLVLVRHAKTEVGAGKADHDRELLPRGRADAQAAGAWLAEELGLTPDLVLCSTAARARQTWGAMAEHDDLAEVEVWSEREVYAASSRELLDVLGQVPEQARCVVLVGHAPGIPELAEVLADPDSSQEEALDQIGDHLPTMGCVVLAHDLPWSELGRQDAAALLVHTPRRADAG